MSCVHHVLGVRVERHAWVRQVTLTDYRISTGTDMWSRRVPVEEVVCHAQYVCRDCGAVRDEGACLCDVAQGETCAVRLAFLEKIGAPEAGAPRSHEVRGTK